MPKCVDCKFEGRCPMGCMLTVALTDDERIQRIKQHAAHEAVPETRTIHEYLYTDSLLGPCVRLSFDPMVQAHFLTGVQYVDVSMELNSARIYESGLNTPTLIGDTIALLTRARDLLKGKA